MTTIGNTYNNTYATAVTEAVAETSADKTTGADVLAEFNITPVTVNGVTKFQLEIAGESNGAPSSFLSFDDVSSLDQYLKDELGLVFVGYHGTAPENVGRILQNGITDTGTRETDDVWSGLYVADDAETAKGYLVNQNDPVAIRQGAVGSQIFRAYAPADTVFLDIKDISLEDLAKLPDTEINAIIRTQAEAQGIDIDSENVVVRGREANGEPATETIIKWNFAEQTVFIPSSIEFDRYSDLTAAGAMALEQEKSLGGTPEYQGFGSSSNSLGIGDPEVVDSADGTTLESVRNDVNNLFGEQVSNRIENLAAGNVDIDSISDEIGRIASDSGINKEAIINAFNRYSNAITHTGDSGNALMNGNRSLMLNDDGRIVELHMIDQDVADGLGADGKVFRTDNNQYYTVDPDSGSLKQFSAMPNAPTVQQLEEVELKKAFNEDRLMVGYTTLNGYFTRLQTQKTINGANAPAATFQLSAMFGGGPVKPTAPSTISVDRPIEPKPSQFFSSAIIVDASDGTYKGSLFVPSDRLATQPVGSISNSVGGGGGAPLDRVLVGLRNGGHRQLKEHAIANGILPNNIGKPGAEDRLWGGGFKINSAVVTNPDGTKTKQSWITVSFTSRQLNQGGPNDNTVPEDVQKQFRQAMADLTGLPVYADGVDPFKAGSSPLTTPTQEQHFGSIEEVVNESSIPTNNGGLPGGSRITETETFHDNGEVATRTSSQNGAEIGYEEFDENGNPTLKRETTNALVAQDDGSNKPVPLESSTYDFPNGTERIVSTTRFSNGVPATKTDYTYGTEDSFGDDLKLEIGDYTEVTISKFIEGQPVKTESKLYDAEEVLISEKQYTYNDYGSGRLTTEKELDGAGKPLSEKTRDAAGNLTFDMQYDAEGTVESMSSATYDDAGNVTSTLKRERYTLGGNLWRETASANGRETMSTYNDQSVKTATGDSLNGQWNGAVRSFDATTGELTKVAVYTNGVEGASYDPATNTFSGINFDGVMSTQDLENFDSIVNSMREEGAIGFFDNQANIDKYGALIQTLDFVQASGLPISSIENFDLASPESFTLNTDEAIEWANKLKTADPSTMKPDALTKINDFARYLQVCKDTGAAVKGVQTMGWLLTNVCAGSIGDIADLGKGFYNFAQSFSGSKIWGRAASELTPDTFTKSLSKVSDVGKLGKIAGPVVAIICLGLEMHAGITSFREAKENGADKAELAYWAFSAIGGGPGGAISAAVDAKQKGYDDGVATRAFFQGLIGMYDPNNPDATIKETVTANREEFQTRVNSRETLANLDIPPNPATGDPGFDGRAILNANSDGDDYYDNAYNWKLEDAFYDYMATYHSDSDSPNNVPRIENVNGHYVGVEWQWAPGQMPVWGAKEGVSTPITSIDDLDILKMTDQPVWSQPDLSITGGDTNGDGERQASEVGPGGFGCWVAREVYGENNPSWLAFREWLVNEAPSWFRNLYFSYGPQFADFIKDKPWLKTQIKAWMDTKIDSNVDFSAPKYVRLMVMYQEEKMGSLVSTEVIRELDFKSVSGNVSPSI